MMPSRIEFPHAVSPHVERNLQTLAEYMDMSMDVVVRRFHLGNGQAAATLNIDGLVDKDILGRDFYSPLLKIKPEQGQLTCEQIASDVLSLGEIQLSADYAQVIDAMLQGMTVLFIEGQTQALYVEAISWAQRSVDEPGTDVVIRGPREGFVETLRVNVSMLRRRIHHPDLVVEKLRLGRYSQTDLCLIYVRGVTRMPVVEELRRRLSAIDIDGILDSGQIEQLIQDTPYSLLPTIGVTEKPDIAAARILEGRVTLLADGSPMALTLPMVFAEGLQSPEDYYTRFQYATWIRIIRSIAFVLNIYLPGFFLAAVCFHPQIIPFKLLLSMAAAQAATPFSSGFSMLLIWLAYEILREAGVRLPKPAGQAVSIVGAIVMGDAAVQAHLLSAPVLIILALTVVSSFVTVAYVDASALLRMIFLILGWTLGFLGLLLGTYLLMVYLCSITSFGAPFFAPFGPLDLQGAKDSLIRPPLWQLKFRPRYFSPNRRRMGERP